jgi:hypothetical protein
MLKKIENKVKKSKKQELNFKKSIRNAGGARMLGERALGCWGSGPLEVEVFGCVCPWLLRFLMIQIHIQLTT